MVHCYAMRVLIDEWREEGNFRVIHVGSHWATVNVDFDEAKFRTSALLQCLKGSKSGRATIADGAFSFSIQHELEEGGSA